MVPVHECEFVLFCRSLDQLILFRKVERLSISMPVMFRVSAGGKGGRWERGRGGGGGGWKKIVERKKKDCFILEVSSC